MTQSLPVSGPFGITGPVVLWGMPLLALLAIGFVIVWVPRRLRRLRGLRAVLLQTGALMLSMTLVLASIGVWVNSSFAFYPSWKDLISPPPTQSQTQRIGAGGASMTDAVRAELRTAAAAPATALQKNPRADPALPGVADSAQGQYLHVTIPGRASDVTGTALIYLPSGYLEHPDRRYPVILAFPGIPGSPPVWDRTFAIGDRIEQLHDAGAFPEAIVVSPDVYPGRTDTECVDRSSGTGSYETWISQDVTGFVRTHLRTVESPEAWATLGYSAGGWCATMISVRHPEVARTSLSLSGYFTPQYSRRQAWNPPNDPRYDLPALVREHRPDVRMYFFVGSEDPEPMASLRRMRPSVTAPTSLDVAIAPGGGHAITLWVPQLRVTLEWLAHTAPGFSPSTSAG